MTRYVFGFVIPFWFGLIGADGRRRSRCMNIWGISSLGQSLLKGLGIRQGLRNMLCSKLFEAQVQAQGTGER